MSAAPLSPRSQDFGILKRQFNQQATTLNLINASRFPSLLNLGVSAAVSGAVGAIFGYSVSIILSTNTPTAWAAIAAIIAGYIGLASVVDTDISSPITKQRSTLINNYYDYAQVLETASFRKYVKDNSLTPTFVNMPALFRQYTAATAPPSSRS